MIDLIRYYLIIINEAVELCKDFMDDTSHGLTNRVLQNVFDQIKNEKESNEIRKNKV